VTWKTVGVVCSQAPSLQWLWALNAVHERRLGAPVFDDDNHHAAVAPVTDESAGRLAEYVCCFTGCHKPSTPRERLQKPGS